MADTTNAVEGLHSMRRRFVDKRINYGASYECRANLAVLASFFDNWESLVLDKLGLDVTPKMQEFFRVIVLIVILLDGGLEEEKEHYQERVDKLQNQKKQVEM